MIREMYLLHWKVRNLDGVRGRLENPCSGGVSWDEHMESWHSDESERRFLLDEEFQSPCKKFRGWHFTQWYLRVSDMMGGRDER